MFRRPSLPLMLLLGLPPVAHAAEATDVLDAIDGNDLFDANLEVSYRAHGKTSKITREDIRAGRHADVVEFLYVEQSQQIVPRARVGIFQDVELFAAWPMTIVETRTGWFHPRNGNRDQAGGQLGYSTFLRDMCLYGGAPDSTGRTAGARPAACSGYPTDGRNTLSGNPGSWPVNHDYGVDADGRPVAGDYNGQDTDWSIDPNTKNFNPQFNSVRGAFKYSVTNGFAAVPTFLGDPELGLAFSPFTIARLNDARDSAMPTMRIELKYQVPIGLLDTPGPSRRNRDKLGGTFQDFSPGGVGSGLHRFTVGASMSKRLKLMDPFVGGHYTLGIPHFYPGIAPERDWRDLAFWTNVAGFMGGVEIVPLYRFPTLEDVVNLRFILGGAAEYVARHRGPSEMSDALHKWTYVDNYMTLMARAAVVLAIPFVTVRGVVEAGHETPHLITGEVPGTDYDGNGITPGERNKFFNPVVDLQGRRIKVTETAVVNGMLTMALTF